MKAKVIIENGITNIILKPENDFEIDILEKIYLKKEKHHIETSVNATYSSGSYQDHEININLSEITK